MKRIENMSKREVRKQMGHLGLRREDERSHDYLLGLVRAAEEQGVDQVAADLDRGAFRREEFHEDYGSADQMRFCAGVLWAFGPKGLLF